MATLQITVTIPDNRVTEVVDLISKHWDYDSASGLTKQQFIQQEVKERLRAAYVAEKLKDSAQVSQQTTLADVNSFSIT